MKLKEPQCSSEEVSADSETVSEENSIAYSTPISDASSTAENAASTSLDRLGPKLVPIALSGANEGMQLLLDLETAKANEPPKLFSRSAICRHFACLVIMLCSISIGYNGTLLNSLLTNSDFRDFFDIHPTGARVGIVTAMYQIGAIVTLPSLGLWLDKWGRRLGIAIGAFATLIGAIIQSIATVSPNPFACLMAGRFFLGAGFAIMTASGPIYVGEIAHPAQRGVITAIYSTFWLVGSILTSALTGGISYSLKGNDLAWEVPIWLQLAFPGLVLALFWTLPESPRWQYTHCKKADAIKMLIEYHGEGEPDSVWVRLQVTEYDKYLKASGSDNRWWDYRPLVSQGSTRQRLICACIVAIFGQCSGNGAISNFISGVLTSAGIGEERMQMNINLGLSGVQLIAAIFGSLAVDKRGRRTLLLSSNIGLTITWAALVAPAALNSSTATSTASSPSAIGFIVLIFIFSLIYAAGFTPVQGLYPSEVLSYEMRAKGMSFVSLVQFLASLVNQFAYSMLLAKIGWKLFIFFAFWCAFQSIVIWLFIPETKNVTLERMEDIFKQRNIVWASLKSRKAHHDVATESV